MRLLEAIQGNFLLVRLADFAEVSRLDAFSRFADDHERERNARISDPLRRHIHAVAHGGLRLALADVKGQAVDAPFKRSATGKPFLDDGPHFSLSHAGACSWLAIDETPVGLDVVELRQEFGRLDDTFVCAQDLHALALNGVPSSGADRVAWAVKEACAKLADDVWREPADWHLAYRDRLMVQSTGNPDILIDLRQVDGNKIAAIARWKEYNRENSCLR